MQVYCLKLEDSVRCKMYWETTTGDAVEEALNTLRNMYDVSDVVKFEVYPGSEGESPDEGWTILVRILETEAELIYYLDEVNGFEFPI